MNWQTAGNALRLAYILRVPIFTLIVLGVLGPVAFKLTMLSNLLDQADGFLQLSLVSFAAFLLAFTALTCVNLTLIYGPLRFGERWALVYSPRRQWILFLFGVVAASTLDAFVYIRTINEEAFNALPLALGAICALGLIFLAKVIQLVFTNPDHTPHPPPFLVFPATLVAPLDRFFLRLYEKRYRRAESLKHFFSPLAQLPLRILKPAGQGYLINPAARSPEPLRLLSGHVFATGLFVLAFISYLWIGKVKSHIDPDTALVPALAFVLLFLIVACWALSALTYFFDRYRFPLLWTVTLLALITAFSKDSDHFFRVEPVAGQAHPEAPTAAEYLKTRIAKGRKRFILVAAPGGGIQAAAWTAQVLTGLDGTGKDADGKPLFRQSVALISSVSGGSLGSMIYSAPFTSPVNTAAVPELATRSAIDEVAWGLTVPDVWRVIIPWLGDKTIDRGWALEEKWAAINQFNVKPHESGIMFFQWEDGARQGSMPALLMNSMLAEKGAPVVFSNTRFPATPNNNDRIRNFYDLFGEDRRRNVDIRVNTAARLSASFSYVAPASRPSLDAPGGVGDHFVDGGYYDNFGMNSLLAWLGEALADPEVLSGLQVEKAAGSNKSQGEPSADILILQLQHFNPVASTNPPPVGWAYQLIAPPDALYNMRDYAQASVAANQLELFARYWSTQGLHVWNTQVAYIGKNNCTDAPLSWKLDINQRNCVKDTWDNWVNPKSEPGATPPSKPKAWQCIADYLGGSDPAAQCTNAAKLETGN